MPNTFISELERAVPSAATLVEGDVLDLWQLYKSAASNSAEVCSELTLYDTLPVRGGLLFPDFFNAVETFVKEWLKKNETIGRSALEKELDETFTAMHEKWSVYEPFFKQHPELRYLKKQSMFSFALKEFAAKLPQVRSLSAPLFWSLGEYHQLRGNLEPYVNLDEALRQHGLVTVFEKEAEGLAGTILAHLKPYGPSEKEIAPYLPLLKHGDSVGFCDIALMEICGKQFVAVTSLQTDLLRKDHVKGVRHDLGQPTTFSPAMGKKEDGQYTVPSHIGRPYLRNHAWVHKILETIEEASGSSGLEGVIVPTTDFILNDYWGEQHKNVVMERLSEYNQGSYNVVPGKRGYKKETGEVEFTLTNHVGKGAFWIKSFR